MDNINHVTAAVIRRCAEKKVSVTETLAAFVARARVLEAPQLYHMDKKLTDEDISELIQTCVERLCARDSPSLRTIQLQVSFEESYHKQQGTIDRISATKEARLGEIFEEIQQVRVRSESDFDALSVLYRKIFNFAMVCTESDHLNDRAVERETAAALESVFPRVALPSFISLSTTDKRVQLHELSNIVFGIRLFNKHIGKGGAQIPDLPGSLSEEMATLNATLKNHIAEVEVVLDQYADVLAYLRHPSRRDESRNSMLTKRLQSELVFWRQMQLFQQQLQDATRVAGEHLRSTRDVFHQDMTELRQIVGSKTSVPKEKVYPRFDALANMWNIFNEESVKVALYTNVYRAVVLFRDQPFKPALRGRDVEAARGASTVADNTTSQQGETKLIEGETEPAGETVLVPLHLLTSKSVRLEMKGFDPCAVALHDGLLLPGDPEVGYVRHRGLYYAVSDTASAGQFLADPEQMLKAIKQVARSTPELVHVLGLGSSFPTVAIHHMVSQGIDMGDGSLLYRGGIDMRASKEMGTQTDTHVVSSFIDKQYEWNEWALRRRALLLTNLRTKRTHSTQTADSHFRRDNATQHYHTQNNDAQTARSAGTMPRKESNYVTGLRGHPDEKMHVC